MEEKLKGSSGDIEQFTIKACVVGIVITVCTILVTDRIIEALEDSTARTIASLHSTFRFGGAEFWLRVKRDLDRAADPSSALPPDEERKLINDVRVIVARWRPFFDAMQDELAKPASNDLRGR